MHMVFTRRAAPPRFVHGRLTVTGYFGSNEVRAALGAVLLRSPHANIPALTKLADPEMEQEQVIGSVLTYQNRGDVWQAAMVSTPGMTFLPPVHEDVLPDLVGLFRHSASAEAEGGIPVCTMGFMISPLMEAWKHIGQDSRLVVMRDYYLRHHGIMQDIRVSRESGRVEETSGNEEDSSDKVAASRNYIWRDRQNAQQAQINVVSVGETGAVITAYAGSRDPSQTFNHIADMTRALHAEGRWVGANVLPDETDKRRTLEELGYEKVGQYGFAVLLLSPRAATSAPR